MQNAAMYNGIKLNGKYAVQTHILTASAVQTAALVSLRVTVFINNNASHCTNSRSGNMRNNRSISN